MSKQKLAGESLAGGSVSSQRDADATGIAFAQHALQQIQMIPAEQRPRMSKFYAGLSFLCDAMSGDVADDFNVFAGQFLFAIPSASSSNPPPTKTPPAEEHVIVSKGRTRKPRSLWVIQQSKDGLAPADIFHKWNQMRPNDRLEIAKDKSISAPSQKCGKTAP